MIVKEELVKQVNKVVAYSQELDLGSIDTSEWIDEWYKNKSRFITLFGDKLIYEFPDKMGFELSESSKLSKVSKFVDWIINSVGNWKLGDYVTTQKYNFYQNITVATDRYPDVPEGMKLCKAFKYFEENENILRLIQDKASEIIQENKIEGYLCLSVHPLDYLSSSESTYNWRSCHSLDGEYRSGNLAYMLDRSTIVCYIKGCDAKLPRFPEDVIWNSKKWRVLLFTDETCGYVMLGRQYPFNCDSALRQIKDKFIQLYTDSDFSSNSHPYWLEDRNPEAFWTPITNFCVDQSFVPYNGELTSKYYYHNKRLKPITKILDKKTFDENQHNPLFFNDLRFSSCYKPHYFWNNFCEHGQLKIGNEVPCPICHKDVITNSNEMMCYKCSLNYGYEFYSCECCGAENRNVEWRDRFGEYLCPSCYEQLTFCSNCGQMFFKDEMVINRTADDIEYLCQDCANDRSITF